MLTFVCGFLSAIIFGVLGYWLFGTPAWVSAFTVFGFLAASVPINLIIRKRLEAIFKDVQGMIEKNQETLRRKMTQMQNKQMSSTKGLQKQMEKKQAAVIRDALEELNRAEPLKKWNVMAEKQMNTLRGQLNYQIKDFDEADQYLAHSLNLDPITVAMKMARAYRHDDMEEVERLYKKGKKRFKKGEQNVIIYALYSWILVQQERTDDAILVLEEAKDKTENPVLKANWEHLVNGRVRQFSNAGLGDQWYALHLEKPKPVRMKQRRGRKQRR